MTIKITGKLIPWGALNEKVRFHNEENGYTVMQLAVDHEEGDQQVITVTGHVDTNDLNDVSVFACTGDWKQTSYGKQLIATSIHVDKMDPKEDIQLYLSANVVEGLSPMMGKRIYDQFGDQAIDILASQSTDQLVKVKGISQEKAQHIMSAWQRDKDASHAKRFLISLGLSSSMVMKVHKSLGLASKEMIEDNPYLLAEMEGLSFKDADNIAKTLDASRTSEERFKMAVLHILKVEESRGHTLITEKDLIQRTATLLSLDEDLLEKYIGSKRLNDNATNNLFDFVSYSSGVNHDGEWKVSLKDEFLAELMIVERLKVLMKGESRIDEDIEIPRAPDTYKDGYSSDQKDALNLLKKHRVVMITGGPGRGKTSILKAGSEMMAASGMGALLQLAPTGKAADRMMEATGNEAKTIHRGLEYHPETGFVRNAENPLAVDAVSIDEMTMTDTKLMARLLAAVPDDAHLMLMGDVDQLPSVGAGAIFRDLIDSGCIPVAKLTEPHRTAAESRIFKFTESINRGEVPDTTIKPADDLFFLRTPENKLQNKVIDLVMKEIPALRGNKPKDIQVLTPMRQGDLGSETLNLLLQERINPPSLDKLEIKLANRVYRFGDKVMCTRNNYDLSVFNGDTGIIVHVDVSHQTVDIEFGRRKVVMTRSQMKDLDLAYAMTIHKSQGSEYTDVVIPFSKAHKHMMTRNLPYTGLTRGKEFVAAVGDKNILEYAVSNTRDMQRSTGLTALVQRFMEPLVAQTLLHETVAVKPEDDKPRIESDEFKICDHDLLMQSI